jgi:hypothetical protein
MPTTLPRFSGNDTMNVSVNGPNDHGYLLPTATRQARGRRNFDFEKRLKLAAPLALGQP